MESKDRNKPNLKIDESFEKNLLRDEAYADLHDFNATKKTVNELLKYKRSLIDMENTDFDKINEIKSKAMDAINNLFDDIINNKKK
jgi:hypothetical protein